MSSPMRYDKFSYAVKRKPERETPSPSGKSKVGKDAAPQGGLQALALTRDGFAIAEDGSLMSRVVSPPRWTPGNGPVVFASTAPTVHDAPSPAHSGASPVPATPLRGGVMAPPTSPATTVKGGSSTAAKAADPWGALLNAVGGKLSEDDLVMLSWDTVADLLEHFGILNPVDVGRVQLTWRRKQELALGNDTVSRDGASTVGATTADGAEALAAESDDIVTPTGGGDQVLVYASPDGQALKQQPIMQIAYGRPASPRRGGRFTPDHKKPLQWKSGPKIDTGRNTLSKARSGSMRQDAL